MRPGRHRIRLGSLRARLAVAAIVAAAAVLASLAPDAFVLDRDRAMGGELWRLYTGHLVHLTLPHFWFDVGAAVLLLLFLRPRASLLWLPAFVGGAVLLVRPDLTSYAGLSGVLHGLTVYAALDLARGSGRIERLTALGLLVGVGAKAAFETVTGTSVFTSGVPMGGETVHVAHLAGVAGALLGEAGARLLTARNKDTQGCAGRRRDDCPGRRSA